MVKVKRSNRTINSVAVKSFHYYSQNQFLQHLMAFVTAYNFTHCLKLLRGIAPYKAICKARRRSLLGSPRTETTKFRR